MILTSKTGFYRSRSLCEAKTRNDRQQSAPVSPVRVGLVVLERTLSMTIGWLVRTSSNSADMSRGGVGP